MKNTISLFMTTGSPKKKASSIAVMLFLMIFSSSCAFSSITSPPQLELRTLDPNEDFTEYTYTYEYCKKSILGICIDKDTTADVYPVSDKAMMKRLKMMNFVLRVRDLPK